MGGGGNLFHYQLGALLTERAAFQHGLEVEEALLVDVQACFNVVQSRADHVQTLEEVVVEDVFSFRSDFVLEGHRVESRIHHRN